MSKPNLNVSIAGLTDIFQKAALPSTFQRSGFWRARFIGPWWLRILTEDTATNVLARGDSTIDALSMQARECPSALDGKPVVALTYGASGPIPWRWVTDELRALDDHTLLGMTRIDLPLLRLMVFPFLLERE